MKLEIKEITDVTDPLIDHVVSMTIAFAGESHIYQRLDFNPQKFEDYVSHFVMDEAAQVYVAVLDGVSLGYTISYVDLIYIDRPQFEIVTLFVPKACRKTGVGRALAKKLADTMDELECHYGHVSICCAMEKDQGLITKLTANMFKKLGFYEVGVVLGRKGEKWVD